jgi:hypothetical protein
VNEKYLDKDMRQHQKDKREAWKADFDKDVKKIDDYYGKLGVGPSASGGLPAAVPPPSATPSAPPTAGGYTVTAGGMVHSFPTQAAADAFRKASGAK